MPRHPGQLAQLGDGQLDRRASFSSGTPFDGVKQDRSHHPDHRKPFARQQDVEEGIGNVLASRPRSSHHRRTFPFLQDGGRRVMKALEVGQFVRVGTLPVPAEFIDPAAPGLALPVTERRAHAAQEAVAQRFFQRLADGRARDSRFLDQLPIGELHLFLSGPARFIHPAQDLAQHMADDADRAPGTVRQHDREELDRHIGDVGPISRKSLENGGWGCVRRSSHATKSPV